MDRRLYVDVDVVQERGRPGRGLEPVEVRSDHRAARSHAGRVEQHARELRAFQALDKGFCLLGDMGRASIDDQENCALSLTSRAANTNPHNE
jgi:hypothetical protein